MTPYGIDKVAVTNSEEDQRLVEKMILEDEVNDYLAKQSEKLSRIMPPRSIGRYKKMARKLLTDPNPDKTSKAWEIFREYENIAAGIK